MDAVGPVEVGSDLARRPGPVTRVRAATWAVGAAEPVPREEQLATEEPLEIRVAGQRTAVTMRTPGSDFELAVGWLYAEGIVGGYHDVTAVRYCTDVELDPDQQFNVVTVDLAPTAPGASGVGPPPGRSYVVSSACGVCGRETIDDLRRRGYPAGAAGEGPLSAAMLASLPDRLREGQRVFDRTGGLHAAGLFDAATGELLAMREDVGRHNAVDKVVGWALLEHRLPLAGAVLAVSGRASFELAQKAVAAGVGALVAVSAPSSLAVQVARELGLVLAGFAREGRITVYAGADRVRAT